MPAASYSDAMSAALQRLRGVGYEHGPSLVNHAPMAAEAMALLGYTDEVPSWLDGNIRRRRYYDLPQPRWKLSGSDPADWGPALGDFSRVSDWSAMFERELAAGPWPGVVARWWPRLLQGMSGALMHGVIRTARAVRSLALASEDDALQRSELAQALGYWAARYWGGLPQDQLGATAAAAPAPRAADQSTAALQVLDKLVAEGAGRYATTAQRAPVPLIHTITGPAAVRLVCDHLPADQHQASYQAAARCSQNIRAHFAAGEGTRQLPAGGPAEIVAAAVELGDEHAIKLAEVAIRYHRLSPDERYLATSQAATAQLAQNA
jgi:Questin oxidase-like